MSDSVSKKLGKVINIDESQIHAHLGELVRGSVEETLNQLLNEEANQLCNADRYERTEARLIGSKIRALLPPSLYAYQPSLRILSRFYSGLKFMRQLS